jgi:hypothetical protein
MKYDVIRCNVVWSDVACYVEVLCGIDMLYGVVWCGVVCYGEV